MLGGNTRTDEKGKQSFEVFVAQVSNDDAKQVVFTSMPAEVDKQAL